MAGSLLRSAPGRALAGGTEPVAAEVNEMARAEAPGFGKRLFLWPKTKSDLQKEMDAELQVPGWGNTWTQPIQNRVNMLATGVRTQIGVKVFGPITAGTGSDKGPTHDASSVSASIA